MWDHRAEIADLRTDVQVLILTVPPLLFILNVFWFGKIVRGLYKLLRGRLAKVCESSDYAQTAMHNMYGFHIEQHHLIDCANVASKHCR